MDNKVELKREREKRTVSLMISIYCRKNITIKVRYVMTVRH